jgi:hypothetical protein
MKVYDEVEIEDGRVCVLVPEQQFRALVQMRDEYSAFLTLVNKNLHGLEKRDSND